MKYEYLKGSEKDFEGAPEFFTIAVKTPEGMVGYCHELCMAVPPIEVIAERRPITEPEWDGVGLPPVGCECEFRKMMRGKPDEFRSGVVSYFSEHTVVIIVNGESGEFVHHPDTCEFRPLRSEADKKREETISEIASILEYRKGCSEIPLSGWIYTAIASGKIPGVKLED